MQRALRACVAASAHSRHRALRSQLVTRLLQQAGFALETAADGREAYDKLTAACEAGAPPHVALIDMMMPHWTGPDCARAFRAWEAQHRPGAPPLPMICLTANVLDEHRAECEAAGYDGFVTKPLAGSMLPQLRARAEAFAAALAAHADARADASSGA